MPNPYIGPGFNAGGAPTNPDLILSITHADWAATINSAPITNNIIPGTQPTAPGGIAKLECALCCQEQAA